MFFIKILSFQIYCFVVFISLLLRKIFFVAEQFYSNLNLKLGKHSPSITIFEASNQSHEVDI